MQYTSRSHFTFFVLGESQSYKNNSKSIAELRDEIIRTISEIKPHLCGNVTYIFNKIVDICGLARDEHAGIHRLELKAITSIRTKYLQLNRTKKKRFM